MPASNIHVMPGSLWFAQVLMEASYASEPIVLKELERVFDAARPTKINPTESYAIDGSFFIAHTEDCWGDIDIEVGEDHADLMSELGSQHICAAEFGERWTQRLAAEIEQILRGHYQIDWVRWRDRIIHTTVTDLDGNTIRDAGSRWELLPISPRHLIRGQFQLDYGCNPD